MHEFCYKLSPNFIGSPFCIEWFKTALSHCRLISNQQSTNTIANNWWQRVWLRIYSKSITTLQPNQLTLSKEPTDLTVESCQGLLFEMADDYISTYQDLFQAHVIQKLITVIYILLVIAVICFGWSKFNVAGHSKPTSKILSKTNIPYKISDENKQSLFWNMHIRQLKHELRCLHVLHLLQPRDLIAPDGKPVIFIKVSSRREFLNKLFQLDKPLNSMKKAVQKDKTKEQVSYKLYAELLTRRTVKKLGFVPQNMLRINIFFANDVEDNCDKLQIKPKSNVSNRKRSKTT